MAIPRYVLWASGLIAAALLIFVVIPRLLAAPAIAAPTAEAAKAAAAGAGAGAAPGATPEEAEAARVAAAAAAERAAAQRMLDTQFGATQAMPEIPDDYPRKKVGACPYSRPMSAPLPVGDVPMCMAIQSDNMYLAGDAGGPGPLGPQVAGSGPVGACGSRTRPAGSPQPYDGVAVSAPTWGI